MIGCDESGPLALEPGGRSFPSRQLTPVGLPADRRCDLVVEPLFYRDDQLGFVVFEADPHLEEECEILREQIAGALKRSELYRHAEAGAASCRRGAASGRGSQPAQEPLPLHRQPRTAHAAEPHRRHHRDAAARAAPPSGGPARALRRDLRSIRTGAQHLARLISDVLDLASSQAGELHLGCEPLHLGDVLAQVDMLGEAMAREKGLSWQSDIPADLPVVWGDRTRLQQVVLNLVSNAIKFTERGYVRLWAEVGRQQVLVAVTDSGMGIAPDEQGFIFDEFRRSERAAQRGYGGMGLGLAISRRLVMLHGGKIGVLSTGADRAGSTFYFTLPAMQADAGAAAGAEDRAGTVLAAD